MKKLLLMLGVVVVIFGVVGCDPAPTTGWIVVNSTPTGAAIFLDGASTGKISNTVLAEVSAGSHTVKLTLVNYKDFETTVNVTAGDTATVDATLEADAYGNLYVMSNPTGAAVWLNDENSGETTNHLFEDLAVGSYDVKLVLADYEDYETTVTIEADETDTVDATLVASTGNIQVNSTPTGAAITLDGSGTGQLTNALLENVAVGSHTIGLTLADHADTSVSVSVTDGGTATVNVTMRYIENPPEEIEIINDEADPSGAWGLSLSDMGHKMAVKLTPPRYPFELTKVIYAPIVWEQNPDAAADPGDAVILATGFGGGPGSELGRMQIAPTAPYEWNEFDATSLDVTITSGDFFYALECIKDYWSLPGYPGILFDFAKPVHEVGWLYSSFTHPDSAGPFDAWLSFMGFGISNPDWPDDMVVGDSVDVMMRVKGLVPGLGEVYLVPSTDRFPEPSWPKAFVPADAVAEPTITSRRLR